MSHTPKIIAVVGFSAKEDRPSHEIATYLHDHGYTVLGINPALAGQAISGITCYGTLSEATLALQGKQQRIHIVNCFRRSDSMLEVAHEAILTGAGCLWM